VLTTENDDTYVGVVGGVRDGTDGVRDETVGGAAL
jgi:hypothetical protein